MGRNVTWEQGFVGTRAVQPSGAPCVAPGSRCHRLEVLNSF